MKQHTRRILALLLPLALLLSTGARAVAGTEYEALPGTAHIMEAGGGALLPRARVYDGQFIDVDPGRWYAVYAAASYEYGLFEGQGAGLFAPNAEITVAELLTLSARLRAAYEGDVIPARTGGEAWYTPYVTYLSGKGLLPAGLDAYNVPATRAQMAGIFALALPENCYDDRNAALVADAYASGEFIADVDDYTPCQADILWLYRQGLLTGMDNAGSYWPERTTTRAETSALVTRIVDPSLRITLNWVVLPYRSAAAVTLGSLIEAPDQVSLSPSVSDDAAVDAAVRQMLAAEQNTITLRYNRPLTGADAHALAQAFTMRVKTYCEQMYNSVLCRTAQNGAAALTFSATACTDEQLARYRAEALARAVEVHDELWEAGRLSDNMSEYQIAHVYFQWLCEHCAYDTPGADAPDSLSHIGYSALILGQAVCDGYTGAYNLFLKLEGIECTALYNDTHIWTVATLDGVEYHIDTTWGDQGSYIAWEYFGMTAAQSYREHRW